MKGLVTNSYLFSSVGLILIVAFSWFMIPEEELFIATEKWKGVCWVGTRSALEGPELKALKATGADAISQTPFGWQSAVNSPEIKWQAVNDKVWWGESSNGLKATLDSSAAMGMMNLLKPHLWVRGSWPGEIEMKTEEDWAIWFDNYRGFILDYAILAEEQGFPMLCVGTELEKTSHREEDWRKVIEQVRKVYSGKLVYAANFTEFEKIKFWDALDYIGIQAYFPLAKSHNPNLKELTKSWETHLPKIEKVVRKFQKPVLFTEIGYCNTVDAAIEPWVWPNERKEIQLSEEVQALCYRAFFETAWQKPWMAGVFFWKWYPEAHGRDPDFTPQGKAAEAVMAEYFLGD
jgi:hypothetical protein